MELEVDATDITGVNKVYSITNSLLSQIIAASTTDKGYHMKK